MALLTQTLELSGWGRYPRSRAQVYPVYQSADIQRVLQQRAGKSVLGRGAGRAYGDAALNQSNLCLDLLGYNRFLAFDDRRGLLHAEAGVTLEEILNTFIPRGWFLPVTPGTKYPTLGGSVACNLHGKNHESLSHHIVRLHLCLADGSQVTCSARERSDLFWATCGGMGLTGIIESVELYLKPIESSYIHYQGSKAENLEEIFRLFEEHREVSLSVAWVDCLARGKNLGRSILMAGEFARRQELKTQAQRKQALAVSRGLKIIVPLEFPSWVLNPLSIAAFNAVLYAKHPHKLEKLMGYDAFFYPLDSILQWNLIYGRQGLVQYQFLIPPQQGFEGIKALLEKISASGRASFLAVLKKFGDQKESSHLSFPGPGYFLALDFPIGDGSIFKLMDEWDQLLLHYGGRIYLAKDARLKAATFSAMYPRLSEWLKIKTHYDPQNVFSSDMARRLGLLSKK